jgi:hypothetical protein
VFTLARKKKAARKKKPEVKRKLTTRKKPVAKKKPVKRPPARAPPVVKAPGKVVVTNDLRRIWLRIRRMWNLNLTAFANALTVLNEKESNMLYDLVRHSLFKGSYVEILQEHPELRDFLKSDEDRLCMHDIYEKLSWRLGRREPLPKDVEVKEKMKGRVGRESGAYEY